MVPSKYLRVCPSFGQPMGSQGSSIGSSSQLGLPPRHFSWGQFSPGMSISIMSISVVFLSSLEDGTIIFPDSRCQYFSGLPTLSQTCSSVIRLCHVYLRSASAATTAPFSLLPLIPGLNRIWEDCIPGKCNYGKRTSKEKVCL